MFPSQARFPNGESIYEMQSRAVRELDAIIRAHPGQIVAIVSHADVIKACVAHYLGVHLDLFQRIVISPASLTVVEVFPLGLQVVCVNDTSHVPEEPKKS
jgi:probable phosphoglycerate mutase